MKKLYKITLIIFTTIMAFVFCDYVCATENTSDGLVVNLTTDKTTYDIGEGIIVDLSIQNTNDYAVVLNNIETMVPEGFELNQDTTNILKNKELNVGETVHLRTKMNGKETNITSTINKTDTQKKDNQVMNVNSDSHAKTEDSMKYEGYLLLGGVSFISFVILIGIKKKNVKKVLLIFLTFGVAFNLFIVNAQAKEVKNQIIVEEKIKYGDKETKLVSKIDYQFGMNDPKEPVEYQDGITEEYLDYTLNEKNKEIIILNSEKVSKWKEGEIHVLKNNSNLIDDIAIEVDSILHLDDGSIKINYTEPDISEVIKLIDYSGSESQEGVIRPADGVVFTQQSNYRMLRSAIQPMALSKDITGSLDMFKTYDFKIKNTDIKGKLCIERINYDFDIKVNALNVDINKLYLTLDSNFTIGMYSSTDFGGERKIELASYAAHIGYGFFVEGRLYINLSANGEINLEYTYDVSCGFDYSNNKFKGVWDLEGRLTKAKIDANLKIGAIAEPRLSFLKIGLVGAEFEYGRNYEMSLDSISIKPLEYCLDAGYYNYATITSVFLPGTWNKKLKTTLMDEENSHIKDNEHFEEVGKVNECTRKYGSLSGTVLKHDGYENVPLYLARVTLEKDGEVMYQTKTGTQGLFTFGKEIEKGTYDLLVRSNYYETYKDTIKIIGNKENNIVEPIVLEPYAKSVLVIGKVINKQSKEPLSNATISVKNFPDREVSCDAEGKYTIEVPMGEQTLIVESKGYKSETYINNFIENLNEINFELVREYKSEVVQIHAGESYQFDFNKEKRIFVRAEELTEYSSYADGDAIYHRSNYDGEYYRSVRNNSHWEIKVYSGCLTVFASDGNFYSEPDSNLSDYCIYSSMNGQDPFATFNISAGKSLTFDNQVDKPKNNPYTIHVFSNDTVTGSERVTDYYYANHFGWESGVNIYELNGIQNYWRPIQNLSKCQIDITRGELTVYFYRLDPITVY